jgi:hypothetical protein
MKTIRNLATLAAVAMMIAACAPSRASAQPLIRGTFNLPFTAQLGSATLPPGSYVLDVNQANGPYFIVTVLGRSTGTASAIALAFPSNPSSPVEGNALKCVSEGSACVVQALELGSVGRTLAFRIHNNVNVEAGKHSRNNHMLQADAPKAVRIVRIAIS